MQVCVNLTRPMIDILEETVRVEVFNNESSIYIPTDAVLASKQTLCMASFYLISWILYITHHPAPDSPDFLRVYPMAPLTDYEEQIRGINRIRNTVINATRRIICYSQTIYDDVRLEMSEYAGLTLAIRDASVLTEVQPMYDFVAIEIIDDDGEFLIFQSQTVSIFTYSLQVLLWDWRRHSTRSQRMWVWSRCALWFTVQTSHVPSNFPLMSASQPSVIHTYSDNVHSNSVRVCAVYAFNNFRIFSNAANGWKWEWHNSSNCF